jgi:hypothetical protein
MGTYSLPVRFDSRGRRFVTRCGVGLTAIGGGEVSAAITIADVVGVSGTEGVIGPVTILWTRPRCRWAEAHTRITALGFFVALLPGQLRLYRRAGLAFVLMLVALRAGVTSSSSSPLSIGPITPAVRGAV